MAMVAEPGARGSPYSTPSALLHAIDVRCRALASAAAGRVFEVPDIEVEAALSAESERGARYDTILSFMRAPRVADLGGFVAALDRILADDGWLFMVEPSRVAGGGLLRNVLPGRLRGPPQDGDRSNGDVVWALRAGGFTVTDLHRCEAPEAPAPWRRYVELRARRESLRAEPGAAPTRTIRGDQ